MRLQIDPRRLIFGAPQRPCCIPHHGIGSLDGARGTESTQMLELSDGLGQQLILEWVIRDAVGSSGVDTACGTSEVLAPGLANPRDQRFGDHHPVFLG